MVWDNILLKCCDFRLRTPIIYKIMVGDPCCKECHRGKHKEFAIRIAKGYSYRVCCTMAKLCIKNYISGRKDEEEW